MTIICDTREKSGHNTHILDYFDQKSIPWVKKKLDYGDYSCFIPADTDLGIQRDLYFTDQIVIERKANLDELASNYVTDRRRIDAEFASAPDHKVLLIENATYGAMVNGFYGSSYNPKSYWASIFSTWHKYNMPVVFLEDNKYTGQFIYGYLYYYVRSLIK